MRKSYLVFLGLMLCGAALGQVQDVIVDGDGTLVAPVNLWTANAQDIAAALSLGNAATKNTGTTAGTVAAGDDSRITGAAQLAGDNAFTGNQSVTGNLTVNGTSTFNGNGTLGGNWTYKGVPMVEGSSSVPGRAVSAVSADWAGSAGWADSAGWAGYAQELSDANSYYTALMRSSGVWSGDLSGLTLALDAATANRTIPGNLTVNGSTTLGDASGDTLTINAGTVTAPNASGTSAANIANVGALDGRYEPKTVVKVLTANTFVCNNSTTLVNTPLFVPLEANTRYLIEVFLSAANNGNASGNKYKINYSGSYNNQGTSFALYRNNIGSLSSDANNSPPAGVTYSFPAGQSSAAVTLITETIYTTTSGTATLQAAQNVADATDNGLRAASYIRATKLP